MTVGSNPPRIPAADMSQFRYGPHISDGAAGLLGRILQVQLTTPDILEEMLNEWVLGEWGSESSGCMEELFLGGYVVCMDGADESTRYVASATPFTWDDIEHRWIWHSGGPWDSFSIVWRSRCFDQDFLRRMHSTQHVEGGIHLYVMENKELASVKVGISKHGALAGRLQSHRSKGWDLVGSTRPLRANVGRLIEEHAIDHFRHCLGTKPSVKREQMPQGGWTETISAKNMSPLDAWLGVLDVTRKIN